MRAMVLAAGLGTRLRPLTDDRPKALVMLGGRTLLEITLARLRAAGIHHVIINVHHFADMVVNYLHANSNFGMHVEISREETLLDTGGGLKKASWFFWEDAGAPDEPFLVHNVDVLSTIDLRRLADAHRESGALATLAVQKRESSRYLLFDEHLRLCGRRMTKTNVTTTSGPCSDPEELAFSGIHVLSPRIFSLMTEEGAFSIVDCYLRLAARETISGFRADEYEWRDLGTPQSLQEAERDDAV